MYLDISARYISKCAFQKSIPPLPSPTAPVRVTDPLTPSTLGPFIEGDTPSFSCEVTSIPQPTVNWNRRMPEGGADQPLNGLPNINITLEDLGNSAYRSNVTVTVEGPEDIAEYFCVASNGLSDDAQSPTITLIAAGKLSS